MTELTAPPRSGPSHAPAPGRGLVARPAVVTEITCRLGLMHTPNDASRWLALGQALSAQQRHREAVDCYERACNRIPRHAALLGALGAALTRVGRHQDARKALEHALTVQPDDPLILNHLARTLAALRDPLAEATRRQARWAQAKEPKQRAAWAYQWGMALQDCGKQDQAARAYRQALLADPHHDDATLNLANLFHANGLLTEAGRRYAGILARHPDDVRALNNQANVLRDAGLVDQALAMQRRAVSIDPQLDALHSNLLNTLQYLPGVTPATLLHDARQWGERSVAKAVQQLGHCPARPRPAARQRPPLRVGYVSSDFWMHAVGLFARSIITHHNPEVVVPYLYANGGRRDALSAELRNAVEQRGGRWHEVASLDNLRLAQQIRADGIDILIDLTGHTAGSRIAMFAYRPCPVQISWLGYYATTGSPAVDFVILDPWHAPAGTESQFSERILRLPHNRFCYHPIEATPDVAPPPAAQRGYVTFGSFNNTAKLNQEVLETWTRILATVPNSHLLLKWRTFSDPDYAASVRAFFVSRGIATERIELRGASPHPEMLAQYADVDIALDPFPFSGGHTSCETLWMGIPIITLPQERVVSRQTLSFLAALGLEHMAATDLNDYVARAVALAHDAPLRNKLRQTLRATMRQSPLCDTRTFTADVEQLLGQAWRDITQPAAALA